MNGCILKVSFVLADLEFCQSSNFYGLADFFFRLFLKIAEEGLSIVQKLWGSSLALRFLFSKAKLVCKKASNANSDRQVEYHSLEILAIAQNLLKNVGLF